MRKIILTMMGVILYVEASVSGVLIYNDGGFHEISTVINDDVQVADSATGAPTTVNIIAGGSIEEVLYTYDNSNINMSAGQVHTFNALNNSNISIYGGTIGRLNGSGSTNLTITNVEITDGFYVNSNGSINFSGGSVAGHFCVYDSTTIDFSGGVSSHILGAYDTSTVNITGGIMDELRAWGYGTLNLHTGSIAYLDARDDGVINIYGKNLTMTSTGGSYGYGWVSGFWANDVSFTIDFNNAEAHTHVNMIPEPATFLLLGLGGLLLRKRSYIRHRNS